MLVCVVKCLLQLLLRLCRFEGKRRKLSSESPAGTGSGNEDARATASDIVAEYVAKWVLCAEKSDSTEDWRQLFSSSLVSRPAALCQLDGIPYEFGTGFYNILRDLLLGMITDANDCMAYSLAHVSSVKLSSDVYPPKQRQPGL